MFYRQYERRAAASAPARSPHPNTKLGRRAWSAAERATQPGRGLIEPERQVTTPLQPGLVGWPVPDPIAGLRAGGVVLERHVRERNGLAGAGRLAPPPSRSLHQRPYPEYRLALMPRTRTQNSRTANQV